MSGREMFVFNPDLFLDDDEADEMVYNPNDGEGTIDNLDPQGEYLGNDNVCFSRFGSPTLTIIYSGGRRRRKWDNNNNYIKH